MVKKVLFVSEIPSSTTKSLIEEQFHTFNNQLDKKHSPTLLSVNHELLDEIINFLTTLPYFQTENSRRALLINAGLDFQLRRQISRHFAMNGSTWQFVTMIVSFLNNYGTLQDGTFPLIALLEELKNWVGSHKQEIISIFIERLKNSQENSQKIDSLFAFEFKFLWSSRLLDFRKELLGFQPQIVHFGGYSDSKSGTIFDNSEALTDSFELVENGVECVLLEAGYHEETLLQTLADHSKYAIGILNNLEKIVTNEFSLAFYRGLQAGKTYEEAFQLSSDAISLLKERDHIKLISRQRLTELECLAYAENLYREGLEYFKKNAFNAAQNALLQMTTIFPEHKDALILLGRIYREISEFDKAIDILERAYQSHPFDSTDELIQALRGAIGQTQNAHRKIEYYQRIDFLQEEQQRRLLERQGQELARMRPQGHALLEIEMVNGQEDLLWQDEIVLKFQVKNKGNAPANDFVMNILTEDETYQIIGEQRFTQEYITPFSPADIIFHIQPHKMAFTLRLDYSYKDTISQQYFYEQPIQLQINNHAFMRIDNPYRSGNLTQYLERGDLSMFYGRQETLAKLREALIDNDERLMLIYGQRRTGKSCLLKYLEKSRCLEPELQVVFINIQRVSSDAEMYRHILERVECLAVSGEQIACQTFDEFVVMLDKLVSHLSRPMLLMLDEFEFVTDAHFQYRILTNADEFLRKMRSFMQYQSKIKFVLAGADGLRTMIKDYRNPLFNAGRAFHIASLAPQEARDLITRPLAKKVDYSPQAALDIQRMTGNHPYYIQLLCQTIVTLLNRKKFHAVTLTEVRQAIDELEKTGDGNIDHMWEITRKESHVILAILAEERRGNDWITRDRIQEVITAENISITEDAVDEAIQELVEKDILLEHPSKSEYVIPMGLLQRWILNHKPLKKIRREVA